jgi:hypothetical protein
MLIFSHNRNDNRKIPSKIRPDLYLKLTEISFFICMFFIFYTTSISFSDKAKNIDEVAQSNIGIRLFLAPCLL